MDFRFALRSLWKNPGFTLLAVLVMGLGIGANTAVFSVVNSVLLKPLSYKNADRIVTLWSLGKTSGGRSQVSGPDFHDWHDQSRSFSAMAYYYSGETSVSLGKSAEYAGFAGVTAEFADVFSIQPGLGRFFNAEEVKTGGKPVAVISHTFWQNRLGGDSGVLGRTLRSFGKTYEIVGVLPAGFTFPDKTDFWCPASSIESETISRSAHNYLVVARLKAAVTVAAAQAEMTGIAARLEQQYPPSNKNKSSLVLPMRDALIGNVRTTLFLILGAVTLVLLIACANVANLLLAKATMRGREIAIRAAVGASRGRIVRQLVTESLVLAGVSAVAGLLLANWGSSALVALAPTNIPRLEETSIDLGVLGFTLLLTVASSLIFGLAPALQASRVDLNDALKQGTSRMTGGGAGRMRSVLVVAEVALSVVLLCGAGLLVKSFIALNNVALGFHPENVLVMGTSYPAASRTEARKAAAFQKELIAQAAAMPGVIAAAGTRMPPGRVMSWGGYHIDHMPGPAAQTSSLPQAVFSVVTPGAIQALRIPLKAGRDFDDRDTYEAPFTALINEALAKQSFPNENPIGRIIFCGFDSPNPMQIVGIVGDIRQGGPEAPPRPEIIMPFQQHPGGAISMRLIVHTSGEPTALADALRQKARALSPDVPVKFTTLETSLAENVAAPRFRTLLFAIFAGLAVCLAMAGVYGVMAYVVTQRSNEVGLRMALGADTADVLKLILSQGMRLTGLGLFLGLLAAAAATRLLSKMLFEVKPGDPMTYVAVAVVLGAVALGACYFPARRAMRVDPLEALRRD